MYDPSGDAFAVNNSKVKSPDIVEDELRNLVRPVSVSDKMYPMAEGEQGTDFKVIACGDHA